MYTATTLPSLIARPLHLSAACAYGISTSKRRYNIARFPLHFRRRHRYLLIILNPVWRSFWPSAKRILLHSRKLVSIILRKQHHRWRKKMSQYLYTRNAGNAITFYSRAIGFFFQTL